MFDGQFWPHQPIQFLDGIQGRPPGFVKYSAHAVNFDGTNDYLTRGADLTGSADLKTGLFSCWVNFTGGDDDGVANRILANTGNFFEINRNATNTISVIGFTPAVALTLSIHSTSTYADGSGWHHILASWNLATGAGYIYIDDIDDFTSGTLNDAAIDYTRTNWSVGAIVGGTFKVTGDMADLMFWQDVSLDLSVTNNRRLFVDEANRPVNPQIAIDVLGTPIVGLYGSATAGWETNLGDGGGFTENGALTDGSSSPSD